MGRATTIFGAFAALIAIASAYDFSDPYFNQYLANELQDLYSSPETSLLHVRNRRDDEAAIEDEKCRRRRGPPMCCGRDLQHNLMDHDLKKQCFQEVFGLKDGEKPKGPPPDPFNCDRPHHRRYETRCIFQCIGQKEDVIDENGQIKEKEMRDHIKNATAGVDWIKSKEDEIIDKCIAETKSKMEDYKKDPAEKEDCKPTIIMLSHCFFREIQLICPDEEIKDKKMCDRIRENISKYGDFPPPPPPGKPPMDDE